MFELFEIRTSHIHQTLHPVFGPCWNGGTKVVEEFSTVDCMRQRFSVGTVRFFQDICGALFEFQDRYTAAAAESFAKTNVANKVHQTLDAGLKARRMVLIEGEKRKREEKTHQEPGDTGPARDWSATRCRVEAKRTFSGI